MRATTLFTLSLKRALFRAQRYGAVLLSQAFALWIFYLYSSIVEVPILQRVVAQEVVGAGMWLMAGFALLFIGQSHASFLRESRADLRLLALLGMRRRRMAAALHLESAWVSLGALLVGTLLGIVFTRLFAMAVAWMLGLPVFNQFAVYPAALARIGLVALTGYAIGLLQTELSVRRLVCGPVRGEACSAPGRPAWPRLAAGAAAMAGAACLSLLPIGSPAGRLAAVAGLMLVGSYLLFTHGALAVLGLIERSEALFYHGTTMIVIRSLAEKLRHSSRVLFGVAALMTGVLTVLMLTVHGMVDSVAVERAPGVWRPWLWLLRTGTLYVPDRLSRELQTYLLVVLCLVGMLVLLATGNLLYVRLFANLSEDRRRFEALSRIGMASQSADHIVTIQMLVLFFMPAAAAVRRPPRRDDGAVRRPGRRQFVMVRPGDLPVDPCALLLLRPPGLPPLAGRGGAPKGAAAREGRPPRMGAKAGALGLAGKAGGGMCHSGSAPQRQRPGR